MSTPGQPPPLPPDAAAARLSHDELRLRRAYRFARLNGGSIAIIGGVCGIVGLLATDLPGFSVGILAALAGFMEYRGSQMLEARREAAISWLASSQLLLFLVIAAYACSRLMAAPRDPFEAVPPELLSYLDRLGIEVELLRELVSEAFFYTYIALIAITFLYQGGLFYYYLSRRKLLH